MKRNDNNLNPKQRQLHKKRILLRFLLLSAACIYLAKESPEDMLYYIMFQTLPALDYKKYYDTFYDEYDASYKIPEWFYEEERGERINNDLASLEGDSKVEETETVPVIIDKSDGVIYEREQLSDPDFLKSKIFSVDGNTSLSDEETRIENLLDMDMTLSDIDSGPKILIYHTHASESFIDSRPGVAEDTVVGVGSYLADLLNDQYGIPTYHDETAYDIIDGHLDRSKAYEKAYEGVSKILSENPTIEVIVDLHRDGVDEDTHLITEVNGKPTAKIMFLNGVSRSNMNGEIEYLNNPNKLSNLAFSFQLYLAGKKDYGDYVRKIYVRSLRYNLHLMPKAALIEAGAQNNTIEEEKNAMEPLAAMLYKVLRKTD